MATTKNTTKTTTARKAAAKRPAKKTAGLPKAEAAAFAALTVAADEVHRIRADLDAAVAHRNRLMAEGYDRGLGVMAITRATGFRSAGAAQAAIKAAKP